MNDAVDSTFFCRSLEKEEVILPFSPSKTEETFGRNVKLEILNESVLY